MAVSLGDCPQVRSGEAVYLVLWSPDNVSVVQQLAAMSGTWWGCCTMILQKHSYSLSLPLGKWSTQGFCSVLSRRCQQASLCSQLTSGVYSSLPLNPHHANSVVIISTILSSRSLMYCSASVFLLLIPSRELLISFIVLFIIVCLLFSSSRSLLNFFLYFLHSISKILDHLYYHYSEVF